MNNLQINNNENILLKNLRQSQLKPLLEQLHLEHIKLEDRRKEAISVQTYSDYKTKLEYLSDKEIRKIMEEIGEVYVRFPIKSQYLKQN